MKLPLLIGVVLLHGLGSCTTAYAKSTTRPSVSRTYKKPNVLPGVLAGAAVGSVATSALASSPSACSQAVAVPEGAYKFGQLTCTRPGKSGCLESFFSSKETPWNEFVQQKLRNPNAVVYSTCHDQKKKYTVLYWKE